MSRWRSRALEQLEREAAMLERQWKMRIERARYEATRAQRQYEMKDVVLDQKRERGKLWFKINWQTGATTEHWIKRRTTSYREQADLEQLQTRVRTLNAEGKTDNEIAAILASEGYRTTKGGQINSVSVYHMRKCWGIRANRQCEDGRNPQRWEDHQLPDSTTL